MCTLHSVSAAEMVHEAMATSLVLPLLLLSYSLVKDIAVAFPGQTNEASGSCMTKE